MKRSETGKRWERVFGALVALSVMLPTGCGSPNLLPYSLDVPPMVLVPASYARVEDGRTRFREIYTAVRDDHGAELPDDRPVDEALLRLVDEPPPTGRYVDLARDGGGLRVLFIPGVFGSCVADTLSPYPYGRPHIEQYGYRTGMIMVSGRSSSQNNGAEIRDALLEMDLAPGEKVVLMGYSKGAVDALQAVVDHPEVRERVAAVVSLAGPIGGSPLADEVTGLYADLVNKTPVLGCPIGDGGAIDSIKRSTRQRWLAEHELPTDVRFYSLVSFAERENISSFLQDNYKKLAKVDPRNDSQVVFSDAIIPGSKLLGFANCDHWALALAFNRDMPLIAATSINRSAFPREVLLESIVRLVSEDLALESALPEE